LTGPECRFMANKRSSDHLHATSGLPAATDIPSAMSAFHPIASAPPPASDVGSTPGKRLSLTHSGSRGSPIRDTLPEGFSHFVTSMTAPVASGWSVRRVGLTPTGKRRLITAHTHLGHLLSQTLGIINVVQYLKYPQLGQCSREGGLDRSRFHRNTKQELEHV